ncbi:hypothetical protein CROQUDRAFT_68260 [Cronartium quercuum f. sp. fusiforme G11]|uniref:MPN domain-containing protein n=1 Tax=Cronartium quercuum f. sp. fusiforme G11 TaxID=708437 RepID=A0A9P6T8G3_9BASI|nr:hypothetical protein CROQUDRAFT_68260 [Cronartium quercuum f. sp. fusiforme G11]
MSTFTLSNKSATKSILHATKYSHSTVIGLLLGNLDEETKTISISDVIPLIHHWSDLSPILEAGLNIANEYAVSIGLIIVGTYIAKERIDDTSLDFVSKSINQSISFDQPIALVIDNNKLKNQNQNPFLSFVFSESNWIPIQFSYNPSPPFNEMHQLCNSISDFDDHLNDIGLDWLVNPLIKID